MHTWTRQAWAVLRKDVLLEARSRANFNAVLFFAGLVVLIFSFALGPNPERLHDAAGGLLWLAFVFSGTLTVGRAYQIEAENSALEGLLLITRSRGAIYAGKLLAVVLVMMTLEILIVPLMSVLYTLNLWGSIVPLFAVGLLGTIGYAAIGTLYGALTMRLRAREVLLPLLMLPAVVPVLLASVESTNAIISGRLQDIAQWLVVLVPFDVVFITAGSLLFDHAVIE